MIEIKRILCPIDFSDHSRHALDHAVTIARWYESTITMLHVCTAVPVAAYAPGTPILPSAVLTPADRDELRASMKRFADDEGVSDLPVQMEVIEGNTVGEILATAERLPSDLLVMGMRGGHARPLVAHRIRDACCWAGWLPWRLMGPARWSPRSPGTSGRPLPDDSPLFRRSACRADVPLPHRQGTDPAELRPTDYFGGRR